MGSMFGVDAAEALGWRAVSATFELPEPRTQNQEPKLTLLSSQFVFRFTFGSEFMGSWVRCSASTRQSPGMAGRIGDLRTA
jgi:hypothetical protein